MNRFRLIDLRNSLALDEQGYCWDDPRIGPLATRAQTRLINAKEAGDEGWWGSWAEMAFLVSHHRPYLTTPRNVARIELASLCNHPIQVNNQFFEYLQFGNGRMPKLCWHDHGHRLVQAYQRNVAATFIDIGDVPQNIQIFTSDPSDVTNGKRVMLQGIDQNGVTVRTVDSVSGVQVQGEYNTLATPFVISPTIWAELTGIQKDVTAGTIQIFKVDPTSGQGVLILTMEPGETVASYRRYYFDNLPCHQRCCNGVAFLTTIDTTGGGVAFGNADQGIAFGNPFSGVVFGNPGISTPTITTTQVHGLVVTTIVKLDPMPLVADSDYFLLQGDGALEAIIEECQSIRYSTMDTPTAKQMSRERHQMAISLLNGVLNHYMGKDQPAVTFYPFGSARLEKVKISMI
jgi:hypothetical protein